MNIIMPKNVTHIIEVLQNAGYEAYAVGGCVRDSVMGRIPHDWDITTSAKPLETKALFKRTIDTGLQHGTVTILLDGEGYEVTTYRIDGEYADSRHPSEVVFTGCLEEDLRRRDFTINAMAYNDREGLVDIFEGIKDIERKQIRCVGEGNERFTEDALRMLRAVRFSAQLGFEIEEATKAAVRQLAGNLTKISAERIQAEMVKLLVSPHPEYLRTAWELGVTAVILPEFDSMMETEQNCVHHCYTVGEHTLKALESVEADKVLRLVMLLHDIGKPAARVTDEKGTDHFYAHGEISADMAGIILRRWKFDNDTYHKVKRLVKYHDLHPALTPKSVRKAICRIGSELFPLFLKVRQADILAQSRETREEKLEELQELQKIYQQILESQECLSLKEMALTGKDLIADGMKPGKEIGEVLAALFAHVLEEPEHNTKEYLLDYSRVLRM